MYNSGVVDYQKEHDRVVISLTPKKVLSAKYKSIYNFAIMQLSLNSILILPIY